MEYFMDIPSTSVLLSNSIRHFSRGCSPSCSIMERLGFSGLFTRSQISGRAQFYFVVDA